MAYSWQGSDGQADTRLQRNGHSDRRPNNPFLRLRYLNYFSGAMSTLNATVIGGGSQVIGNVSSALQQTFNVSYSDPFTSTVLGYLKPMAYFLFAVVTNQKLFFTLVAVDLILIAFDVTWIEESEE